MVSLPHTLPLTPLPISLTHHPLTPLLLSLTHHPLTPLLLSLTHHSLFLYSFHTSLPLPLLLSLTHHSFLYSSPPHFTPLCSLTPPPLTHHPSHFTPSCSPHSPTPHSLSILLIWRVWSALTQLSPTELTQQ